jgi:hypothetical protein
MKKLLAVVLAVVWVAAMASVAGAGKQETGKPGIVVTDVSVAKATVDAIDYDKRTVTLKGPEGKTLTLKVDKNAKNFDQVKKGDQVTAQYYESIAVFVRKAGDQPSAAGLDTVQVAPPGQKPAAIAVNTAELTAKVEAIDYKKRTLTLKGPEGNTKTLKIDKSVKKFKNIKQGDDVVVRLTEAVAISVQSPQP